MPSSGRRRRDDARVEYDRHPRPGQLQDQSAVEVDDEAAFHRPEQDADAEGPVVDLGLPQDVVLGRRLDQVGLALGRLQPAKRGRGAVGAELVVALVVHPEDAAEPEDADPRRAERDADRQHQVEPDIDRCDLTARIVGIDHRLHLECGGDAQADRADCDVDLAADLAGARLVTGADFKVAAAGNRTRHVDAGAEGGQFGRTDRLFEIDPQPHPLDRHDAEIDAAADINLEGQRVGARQPGAEDLEDLVEWRATLIEPPRATSMVKPFEASNTGFRVKLGCRASSRLPNRRPIAL